MGFKSTFKRYFDLEEETVELGGTEGEEVAASSVDMRQKRSRRSEASNVVGLTRPETETKRQLITVDTTAYEDVLTISDHLKNRHPVVFNIKNLSMDDATRMIDFISGAVHITSGTIEKVRPHTFLCSLDRLDVKDNWLESIKDM